jgi:hypothetical protein
LQKKINKVVVRLAKGANDKASKVLNRAAAQIERKKKLAETTKQELAQEISDLLDQVAAM